MFKAMWGVGAILAFMLRVLLTVMDQVYAVLYTHVPSKYQARQCVGVWGVCVGTSVGVGAVRCTAPASAAPLLYVSMFVLCVPSWYARDEVGVELANRQ